MAPSSGSSGPSYSYREWAAAERAAQKAREQKERQAQKDRIAAEAEARDKEAADKTEEIERRVAELEHLLRASLARNPRMPVISHWNGRTWTRLTSSGVTIRRCFPVVLMPAGQSASRGRS